MIVSFKNRATEDIFDSNDSKAARKLCPPNLWSTARRKLDQLNAVTSLEELTIPPGNRLEALKGDRKGQHSIRINQRLGARSLAEETSAGSHRSIGFVFCGHNREQAK